MVGWNVGLTEDQAELARMRTLFRPAAFPPLPQRKSFADAVRHVYDFYRAV
jgi:hypothetical protein